MIETKIACQCGNRFKFGMDLVNGRAPEGLACPTCGAPATSACNALVDFLNGKEPALGTTDSRPLKEIRVVCPCGARYKFDLELGEKEMPGAVTCPQCQADLTGKANEEISNYVAHHPLNASAPVAAGAPASSPIAPSAREATPTSSPAQPAAGTEAVAPPPVAANVSPTAPASAPAVPAAPPAPAGDVPPPSSSSPSPAPQASKAAATPIEDPFGPAPTTKTSGPNLKPLEVPRPNRPPPGSRPATPTAGSKPSPGPTGTPSAGAKPTSAAKPDAGKPDSAKPGAKPVVKTATKEVSGPNFNLGVAGAAGGALVGAIIWFIILKATPMTASWMAIVVGLLSGGAARLLGRGGSPNLGKIACLCSSLCIGLMIWLGMLRYSDRQAESMLGAQYQQAVALAQQAVKADDAQLKAIIAQTRPSADLDGNLITAADIQKFRMNELPKLKERADGSAADKSKFYSERIAAFRSAQAWDEVWQETFGIFGLLLALAGIFAPAKLAG